MTIAQVRKAIIGGFALLAQVVAEGLLAGTALHVAQAVLVAAGVAGIYRVENAPAPQPAGEGGYGLVEVGVFVFLVALAYLVLRNAGAL